MRERKDGVRERKIEPKPVSNTHPQSCDFYTPRVRWLDGKKATETRVREIKDGKMATKNREKTTPLCEKYADFNALID